MDLSRLQKVSSKSESEPKSFSGPSSPREQMLLEDDAVAGEGPAYSVSVYGMSILVSFFFFFFFFFFSFFPLFFFLFAF